MSLKRVSPDLLRTNMTLHKTMHRFKTDQWPFFHGSLSGHAIISFLTISNVTHNTSNVVTTSFNALSLTSNHTLKDTFHYPKSTNPIVKHIKQYSNKYTPKGSAICVQRFDDSQSSAIRITYRISLRSSSNQEPRYPSYTVIVFTYYKTTSIHQFMSHNTNQQIPTGITPTGYNHAN